MKSGINPHLNRLFTLIVAAGRFEVKYQRCIYTMYGYVNTTVHSKVNTTELHREAQFDYPCRGCGLASYREDKFFVAGVNDHHTYPMQKILSDVVSGQTEPLPAVRER